MNMHTPIEPREAAAMQSAIETMIAIQIAAYPSGWTDQEYREMAVEHLFGKAAVQIVPRSESQLATSAMRRRMRVALRERDGDDCYWCKQPLHFPVQALDNQRKDMATIEHLIERRNGGSDDIGNLVLAHHWCNLKRDHAATATPAQAKAVLAVRL